MPVTSRVSPSRHTGHLAASAPFTPLALQTLAGVVLHTDQGGEGGFRWSSRTSIWRCVDGTTAWVGGGDIRAARDVIAGKAAGGDA